MYYPNEIEPICFQPEHIDRVLAEIRIHLPEYFEKYLETDAGRSVPDIKIQELVQILGATAAPKRKKLDGRKVLERIKKAAIAKFEKDRQKYIEILDPEALEEYGHDPASFKNTVLRNQCPVIHKTLKNVKAKELDRYREAFNVADPKELYRVVSNLAEFGRDYIVEKYEEELFERCSSVDDLRFNELRTDKYTYLGVIGGGIKSHLLFKLYPQVFPNRSQDAIWALWYLTDKKTFGCREDSEFLMINQRDATTQQNYFYPYYLFAFYALQIYHLLLKQYHKSGVTIPTEYRFVIVDNFLSFVTSCHREETDMLKRQPNDDGYGY